MQNQRELFEIKRGTNRLSVAVRGRGRRRRYIGSINGQVRATALGKGDLLRVLIGMTTSPLAAEVR